MVYPEWLNRLSGAEHEIARVQFLIRLFSLYATEEGSVKSFREFMNFGPVTLKVDVKPRQFRPIRIEAAIAIENKLGREIAPRELLRPEVFAVPEKI